MRMFLVPDSLGGKSLRLALRDIAQIYHERLLSFVESLRKSKLAFGMALIKLISLIFSVRTVFECTR